jgi:hypothetical protein
MPALTFGGQADAVASENVKETQGALAKDKFDLAISDLRLAGSGGKEGLKLLSYVRSTYPETKVRSGLDRPQFPFDCPQGDDKKWTMSMVSAA